ncbi:MAG: glycosyltransferase, partial [Patescibacteria group bacterium]
MTTKILFVITKANWGGAQRYVYDLATAARAAGHDVLVVYGEQGLLVKHLTKAGVRAVAVPELGRDMRFGKDISAYRKLFRIFKKELPSVVHVNSAKAGGLGALAARIAGVSLIIFTAHGWEFNAPRNALSKIGIRFFSWLTMLLAHRTIAVSEAVRRDVRNWPCIARRIVVIRNGIECSPLLSREEARATLAPRAVGQYWVGMISELNPTKCVADAIRAFALIVQK